MYMRVRQNHSGFTIVELLIVIVVIGILAALVLNSFAGVQQKARDTERQTDTKALATQLEAWYNNEQGGKNYYPTVAQMTDATNNPNWITTNLKGIDAGAIAAPGKSETSLQAFSGTASDTNPGKDRYAYQGLNCVAAGCAGFNIYYSKEGVDAGTKTVTVKSLNGQ